MRKIFLLSALLFSLLCINAQVENFPLTFNSIPTSWDEGFPLGNGITGALVWQKAGKLRLSLDRADLWDERPMKGLHRTEFSYAWVRQQWLKGDYKNVQQYFDEPYDHEPAPTKIPGAALEIDQQAFGKVIHSSLDLMKAICTIQWENGNRFETFVNATDESGYFRFSSLQNDCIINLIAPKYEGNPTKGGDVVGGDDLTRLGYPKGKITYSQNGITYLQEGWNGFRYRVTVRWKKITNGITEGIWKISTASNKELPADTLQLDQQLSKGFSFYERAHIAWWKKFWAASSITVPDKLLQQQWYLEMYKFGSAARKNAPPISLQAIWTADNGRIPPWKGDYHHDLNTQLSYWPAYSSNHLDEAMGYLDHLDGNRKNYQRYTQQYFGVEGLNVPGVTTLNGTEMGGWIQYALSPTVSAWLAQHFYLQWRYSMDTAFLKQRAYPWMKDAAAFLEQISYMDSAGKRRLPLSSSPEINDNSRNAWFATNTNYDLALMKFCFSKAAEMATVLKLYKEAAHWNTILNSFADFELSSQNELLFAKDFAYSQSHRHFSHLMAIHPLGLINWEDGEKSKSIIRSSLKLLDSIGPAQWVGYSYAWEANLKARAKDGAGAAKALTIFASAFCSKNSFHLNGDQTKSGYSHFQYRPFTLEGNFAFASGLQEMLIQSHAGFIEVMPAVPGEWNDISFHHLRTEGAFLVDAKKENGRITHITVYAEKNGEMKLKFPFTNFTKEISGNINGIKMEKGFLFAKMKAGSSLQLNINSF